VPTFVDTNVLVYARDSSEGVKQERAVAWLGHLWESRTGRLSFQVLQEFYVTATQKLDPGLEEELARADVRSFLAWRPLEIGAQLIEDAWRITDRFALSFWDALVVSAARASGCELLLTEDLQDGQVLDGLRVVNPFAEDPPHLS
jgi:predicted nucleic acid-binding protein